MTKPDEHERDQTTLTQGRGATPSPPAHPEESSTINDGSHARPAVSSPAERRSVANVAGEPRLHLILGPVGAGKSTLALRLAEERGAVRLTLDEWMADLFRADRPESGLVAWYAERAERCIARIWSLTLSILAAGPEVILEIGLLDRAARRRFHARVMAAKTDLAVIVVDAERAVRRERVEARNRARGATFSMVVPPAVFELASDLWEPLEPDELGGARRCLVRTDDA